MPHSYASLTRAVGGRLTPEALTEFAANRDLYADHVLDEYEAFMDGLRRLLAPVNSEDS
jgi:hypothetical protein